MALSNLQLNPQFVQAVRDAVDIVDIASGYTKLARAGKKWKGLCPLHKEKTPSFNVDSDLGFFKCFGCGAGGDAIKLHMLLSGDDFPAAMESLATRFGVPLPAPAASHRGRSRSESATDPEAILDAAAEWYRAELGRSEPVRAYLERRKIDPELAERYGLGYAPEGWRRLIQQFDGKFSIGELLEVGLVVRPDSGGEPYDRFRHRLIFPIRNAAGRLLGFGGRALGDDLAKYVNTSETERFRKGTLLYGLDLAKKAIRDQRRALLVEGYVDVLGAVSAGLEGAVASMGTSLTVEQARLVARFADEVVLGYDADDAGETACRRALPILLGQGLAVRRLRLPAGEDPDSYRVKAGVAALKAAFDEAEDLVVAELDRLAPPELHRNPHGRARAAKEVTELLGAVPDSIARYGYARVAADKLGVPVDLVWRRLGGRSALESGLEPERAPAPRAVVAVGREREAVRTLLQVLTEGRPVELPDRLPPLEAFEDPAHKEFFGAFLRLYERAGAVPSLRELVAESEAVPDSSAKLADLLVESSDSPAAGNLGDALRDIRRKWVRSRRDELARLMREAERRADKERFEELLREKKRLEIELYPTAPNAGLGE